jgi:hypothetical protein
MDSTARRELWPPLSLDGRSLCKLGYRIARDDRDVLDRAFPGSRRSAVRRPLGRHLFDFLFRWLPGMAEDGLLVGTNYTRQLHGLELEPLELQKEIMVRMTGERFLEYRQRLDEGLEVQKGP